MICLIYQFYLPLRGNLWKISMKRAILLVIPGVVIMIFGIVFHGQGHGEIGPETSFMYQNPDWITFGFEIAILGLLIICGSIGYAVYCAKKR